MFKKLIALEQCPPGGAVFAELDGKELAVFHVADTDEFVVTLNACPHASGNLSAGTLTGHNITCPVHHWKFDLNTGYCIGTEDTLLKRYACKVEEGYVHVDLDQPLRPPPPPSYRF